MRSAPIPPTVFTTCHCGDLISAKIPPEDRTCPRDRGTVSVDLTATFEFAPGAQRLVNDTYFVDGIHQTAWTPEEFERIHAEVVKTLEITQPIADYIKAKEVEGISLTRTKEPRDA